MSKIFCSWLQFIVFQEINLCCWIFLIFFEKKNLITSMSCLVNTKKNLNCDFLLHKTSSCPSSYLNTNLITLPLRSLTSLWFSLSVNEAGVCPNLNVKKIFVSKKKTFRNEIPNHFLCTKNRNTREILFSLQTYKRKKL